MIASFIAGVLTRDLKTLKREIEAYPDEGALWRVAPGIGNPGGTLALHLAGNVQYFIGAVLGGTGYRRDRDAEFQRRNLPRREVLLQVDAAIAAVETGLATLDDTALARDYPETVGGITVKTGDFLLHLVAHCTYHLGQVDYHRRLVTGQGTTVGAVPIGELRTARKPA